MTAEGVALRFFRSWPEYLASCPALHSSLQSLETSFILLAMERFPHALVNCASVHEGVLKLAPNLRSSRSSSVGDLYARAVALHPSLARFGTADLDAFRRARNKYVHEGFTNDDNAVAAELLLKIGLPFLRACYDEFYGFDFVDNLVAEFGEQLRISLDVYQMARNIPGLSFGYCFSAFGHLIQWSVAQSQLAGWEYEASTHADETGVKYGSCSRQRDELERVFGSAWRFDCPICDEVEMFVCELDEVSLGVGEVALKRAACPSCRLFVRENCPFLSDALCQTQLAKEQGTILREFGITSG